MENQRAYRQNRIAAQRGFSLAEMMVSMVILLVVIGGVMQLLNQSQQRYVSTANVEDSTAMAREAVDLMTRDIRMAGYPGPSAYPAGVIVPGTNAQYTAVAGGFIATGPAPAAPPPPFGTSYIKFEADAGAPARCGSTFQITDFRCAGNTGLVSVIEYQLQVPPSPPAGCGGFPTNASLTTPTLMRSQGFKQASGAAPAPQWVPLVSDVVNCGGGLNVPIFTFCQALPRLAATPGTVWPGSPCPDMRQFDRTTLPFPGNTRIVVIRLQVRTRNRDPQTQQFQIVEFYNVAERANPES